MPLAQGISIPSALKNFISEINAQQSENTKPLLRVIKLKEDVYKIAVQYDFHRSIALKELSIQIRPAFCPTFNWAPHLTLDSNYIIAQHVFRAPALIAANDHHSIAIIPDLDLVKKQAAPWFMDMDAPKNIFTIGMSNSVVEGHVLYKKNGNILLPKGNLTIGFYIIVSSLKEPVKNPFRHALQFMWQKWGRPLYKSGAPLYKKDLWPYVHQTYQWAFKSWQTAVWQAFELNGKNVGAPVFIVNTTQSPNYNGMINEREFRSIWNQAWFNSLRSASGLYRYARRFKIDSLLQKARMTKELALAFPQKNGFFQSVIATEMETVTIGKKKYNRSKGWDTKYFGNSNRNPYTWDIRQSPYHIADMSYTATWMLVWYKELEKDKRLLHYAIRYADALIQLQDAEGFFPAWLSLHELLPMQHLNQSPETSASITFLLKLYAVTKNKKYFHSAQKAMKAVMQHVIPVGQWEDFETYWSCSRVGSDDWVGKKIPRNNMFKQNNFSIYWTAEALLEMYRTTKKNVYLQQGQRVLDELLMYQATWQPPFIAIQALGGFGVMNADAEWNDSRQSLFAGLMLEYGEILNNQEYAERGKAALGAAFAMMYTPLNPATLQQWKLRWPFFGKEDEGFMMENYGHDGVTDNKGLGIGEFTIYDWGNGAAAEAYNRMKDQYENILE